MSRIRNGVGLLSRHRWGLLQPYGCSTLTLQPRNSFSTGRITKSANSIPQLTLYTGTDCQLCDVAKEVLDKIAKETPFDLHLYNIRDNSLPDIQKWRRAYQYDIPVLHLNGKEIARHRLNKESVLDQIKQATNQSSNEK
ncbi:DUF836-domain-containing protein [Meira miltonrushii]|uniref:Glutaredoxin-like protein n=1 Tax=Meira miltonrushii TaxID=1280837 RepID=A0A316VQS5_9BASI|nr:DUF836-domain-containing protein [Meira miltonrushii]PWN37855.1 DUF836-domain-containing protein [Meira miltonrushii]